MTRFCISTNFTSGDLNQKFSMIARAGFHGIELYEQDVIDFVGSYGDIALLANNHKLSIDVFQPLMGFKNLNEKCDIAHALGAKILLLNISDVLSDDMIADFKHDISNNNLHCPIALMASPSPDYSQIEQQILKIIEEVDSPYIGLALNSMPSLINGTPTARLRNIDGCKIFHVQLSDAPTLNVDVQKSENTSHFMPGQGVLNIESFVRMIARAEYKGAWSIAKVKLDNNNSDDHYIRDGYRALVSLLDEIVYSEPSLPPPLPDLPKARHLIGVEFIEFAVDKKSYERLTHILKTLCFRKERYHISKNVELWRQGAINIIINAETKGLAAKAFATHGASICDIGLRVDNVKETMQRATQLGTTAFIQAVNEGELNIPAIEGVGSTIIHFIDEESDLHRLWDVEFNTIDNSFTHQPAGLRRIDHIAQTMEYDKMQSWLTYYLSTFKMEKAPIVDVVDPSGIILSQAIASPNGEVRLNLNTTSESQTFAGSFLDKKLGANVQHVAFVSDDIFETSQILEQAGFERLTIDDNYYKDIKLRFSLSDDFTMALQSQNILYDKDNDSEYFQIYSIAFFNGFFFEIVERRNHYKDYGARNAPTRLNAQMAYINNTGVRE